jgi:hypothetical protein
MDAFFAHVATCALGAKRSETCAGNRERERHVHK